MNKTTNTLLSLKVVRRWKISSPAPIMKIECQASSVSALQGDRREIREIGGDSRGDARGL